MLYVHCSSKCATVGQTVQKVEDISYIGSTGNSKGNHLHFEFLVNANRFDPAGLCRLRCSIIMTPNNR